MMSLRVLRSCRITSSRILNGSCASVCASAMGRSDMAARRISLPKSRCGVAGHVVDHRGKRAAGSGEKAHERAAVGYARRDRQLRDAARRVERAAVDLMPRAVEEDDFSDGGLVRDEADVRSKRVGALDEDEMLFGGTGGIDERHVLA